MAEFVGSSRFSEGAPQPRPTARGLLRFVIALSSTSFRATLALRGAFLVQALFMMLNNAIFFCLWLLMFQRFERIGGYTVHDMLLLYGLVAGAFGFCVVFAGGTRDLSRTISDGELDALLCLPKPAIVHAVGRRSLASGWGDLVSGIVLMALSGHLHLVGVPVMIVGILSGGTVLLASGIVIQSLAFWFGRVEGVTRQLWECVIAFSVYPDPIFGGGLRVLLFTVLPAGFVGFVPAHMIAAPSLTTIGITLLAALGYGALALFVFERGLRRYESGNRF